MIRWEFQDIYPQNMALYGTVPPFQDPGIPIEWFMLVDGFHDLNLRSHHLLVGGWKTHLKKYEFVSWDDEIPN